MAHELLAKSDHQLGMCLRMLYAEGVRGPLPVHSAKNEKGKMEFLVTVPVDDAFLDNGVAHVFDLPIGMKGVRAFFPL